MIEINEAPLAPPRRTDHVLPTNALDDEEDDGTPEWQADAEDAALHAAVETRWDGMSATAVITDAGYYLGRGIFCGSREEYVEGLATIFKMAWNEAVPTVDGEALHEPTEALVEAGVGRALRAVQDHLRAFRWT